MARYEDDCLLRKTMKMLNGLFLQLTGSQLLAALTIGMIIRAYFVMGLTSVV